MKRASSKARKNAACATSHAEPIPPWHALVAGSCVLLATRRGNLPPRRRPSACRSGRGGPLCRVRSGPVVAAARARGCAKDTPAVTKVCIAIMDNPRHRAWKRRVSRAVETRVINPLVRALLARGRLGSTYAVLETTGRKTGRVRRIPVANGSEGETFWLLAAHGRSANYVPNISANPRVCVGLVQGRTLQWRSGIARPLPDEDARARQRDLGRGRIGYKLDALTRSSTTTLAWPTSSCWQTSAPRPSPRSLRARWTGSPAKAWARD
jgi:deazaflavin-dependent oxidoreductase (nitroreductase family)